MQSAAEPIEEMELFSDLPKSRKAFYSGNSDVRKKLHMLSHLNLSEQEARWHWERIRLHHQNMSRTLGRDIGFTVALTDYFVNIAKKITTPKVLELAEYNRTLKEGLKDPLTSLYNRKYMNIAIKNEKKRAKRYGHVFSLLFIDIDFFKKINDEFGHHAGDIVLQETANILIKVSRGEDFVFRYGGEEFVILMPHTAKNDAIHLANRLRRTVSEHKYPELPEGRQVTISGGISSYPADGDSTQVLINEADQCLYEAKRSGRNRIVSFRQKHKPSADGADFQLQDCVTAQPTLFSMEKVFSHN